MLQLNHRNYAAMRLLIVSILLIGIFFRLVNLDQKVYWHDEAYTSFRVAGYKRAEIEQQVFAGREVRIVELQKYQQLNSERGLIDTLESLAVEDPQHPPLYYLTLRLWVQWFGSDVAIIRSLTALTSLLVFPSIYWLCLELFELSLVGEIAMALIAVSPIHVLFAQEAREYCLWTVTILLSSAALLRAMRLNTKTSWGIYTITLSLSFYTFLLSALVAISHGLYVGAIAGWRLSKSTTNYLLATFIAVVIFVPWLLTVIINFYMFQITTGWTSIGGSPAVLITGWLLNLSRIFLDFDSDVGQMFVYLILVAIAGYLIYFLYRYAAPRPQLFIITLFGTTALFLILSDLIRGGISSIVPRYLFPCYLGVQLAVAYLIAWQLSSKKWQLRLGQLLLFTIISSGIISCSISSQAETWWIKTISTNHPQIARTINQTAQPLLLSSSFGSNLGNMISLSYLLEPKVRLQLVNPPQLPQISKPFSDIFLFDDDSSGQWRSRLEKEQGYKLELIYTQLWRLK